MPGQNSGKRRSLINSLGFVLGFTVMFILLGAAAGTFGRFLKEHTVLFNIICGAILVLFGLNYMEVVNVGFLNKTLRPNIKIGPLGFFSSVLFGFIFSIGWTPCVGAFLGSALMLAANSQETLKGIVMLLLFSLGLGIPFVISAVLIDSLKSAFDAIKKHYRAICNVSGLLLIAVGLLMAFGRLNAFLSLLTIR